MQEKKEELRPRIISGRATSSSPVPAPGIISGRTPAVPASSGRVPAASGRASAATGIISGRSPVVPATPAVSGRNPAAPTGSSRMATRPNQTIDVKSTASKSSRATAPLEKAQTQSGRARSSSRNSSRANVVEEMEDLDANGKSVRSRSKTSFFQKYPKQIKIGGAVASVLLLVVIAYVAARSGKTKDTREFKGTNEQLTDKTPSSVWASRAQAKLAKGDKQGARTDYLSAAEAAEREGRSSQATQYSAIAYDIGKTSTLSDLH